MDDQEQREIEDSLKEKIASYHEAALLFTAISAGIPDLLNQGPRTPESLAEDLGLQAQPLRRLLRGLVAMRLCEEQEDGHFTLTPAAKALTYGNPSNLSEKAFMVVGQYWMPWMSLMFTLRTGAPSLPFALNKTAADWRGAKSDEGRFLFRYVAKEELAQGSDLTHALASAFGALGDGATVASIGGGYGAWLADLLHRHPQAKGVIFDAPPVLDDAKKLFDALELTGRIDFYAGDPVESVPDDAGLYVLKNVLQTKDDEAAARILTNCGAALKPNARIAVVERLMPEAPADDPAAVMLDLHMMAITGGKARTLAELTALAEAASLTLTGQHTLPDGTAVLTLQKA